MLDIHLSHSYFINFFNNDASTEIYTLSLHDALPISKYAGRGMLHRGPRMTLSCRSVVACLLGFSSIAGAVLAQQGDRKSTRLNSSHLGISYAVFCLKKKTRSQLEQEMNWRLQW